MFCKIAQKVARNLGYICEKICCKTLLKISASGHADTLGTQPKAPYMWMYCTNNFICKQNGSISLNGHRNAYVGTYSL